MLKKALIFLVIGSVFLSWAGICQAAFGISPPSVKNDHLLKGSYFEQKIILSRSDPKEDLRAEVTIDAPQIADWITIDKGLSFILPKGEQQVPMIVLIDVPEDVALGNYEGKIRVSTLPAGEGMVTIALGGEIRIKLAVTEEKVFNLEVKVIDIADLKEGEPIRVSVKIANTGNIAGAPSKVHLDVYGINYQNILESKDVTNLEKINPFKTEQIFAEFETNLGLGQYWGKVRVFQDEEILREGKIFFKILEKEILPIEKENEKEKWFFYLYIAAGAIFLIVIALLIWAERKRRRMAPQEKKTIKIMDIKKKEE